MGVLFIALAIIIGAMLIGMLLQNADIVYMSIIAMLVDGLLIVIFTLVMIAWTIGGLR